MPMLSAVATFTQTSDDINGDMARGRTRYIEYVASDLPGLVRDERLDVDGVNFRVVVDPDIVAPGDMRRAYLMETNT